MSLPLYDKMNILETGEDYRNAEPAKPFKPYTSAKDRKTGRTTLIVSGVLIIVLFIAFIIMMVLYFQPKTYQKDVEEDTREPITSITMDNCTSMSQKDISDFKTREFLKEVKKAVNQVKALLKTDQVSPTPEHDGPGILKSLEMIQTAVQTLQKKEGNVSGALAAMKEEFDDTLFKISSGWKQNGKILYYFSSGKKNWNDSETYCASKNSHLTSIQTREEQSYLLSAGGFNDYWIGLTDEGSEANFRFLDDSPYRDLGFWGGDGPDNSGDNEHCVHLSQNTKWNDNNCAVKFKWICKKYISI